MERILVITRDVGWKKQLLREPEGHGFKLSFVKGLHSQIDRGRVGQSDWIILDANLLPRPESPTTNILYRLFREKPVVAVYSPSALLGLKEYRAINIIGVLDVVQKPSTRREIGRLLEANTVKLDERKAKDLWQPAIQYP
jgi:hypothetical protein